jgi:hypothetical protein
MSLTMIVTRFAWIAHRFASSNKCTRNASVAYSSPPPTCKIVIHVRE